MKHQKRQRNNWFLGILWSSVWYGRPCYISTIYNLKRPAMVYIERYFKRLCCYWSNIIQKLYENNEVCIVNNGLQSDWVTMERSEAEMWQTTSSSAGLGHEEQ